MTSTLFLGLLLAFRLWYLAAGPRPRARPSGAAAAAAAYPRMVWWAGVGLASLVAAGFVLRLGWAAGLSAWLVALMGAGCLVVTLAPFRHLGRVGLGVLYLILLTLELAC